MKKVADTSDGEGELDKCVKNSDKTNNTKFQNTYKKMQDEAIKIDTIWVKKCNKTACSHENLEKMYKKSKKVKNLLVEMQKTLTSCEILDEIIAKIQKAEKLCKSYFA